MKAVVLLSGGVDSSTALGMARAKGRECYALSFEYGQRHERELKAAQEVARALGAADHRVAQIDLRLFGGSALTAPIEVPKDRAPDELRHGIPITYVPARNTIFLSFALAWAEVLQAPEIFIGANVLDASGYPDCRPAFLAAFEALAKEGTRAGAEERYTYRVRAPLIEMTKSEIIRTGVSLGLDYGMTWSCYDPQGDLACGRCDTCQLRLQGFREAGIPDPVPYDGGS